MTTLRLRHFAAAALALSFSSGIHAADPVNCDDISESECNDLRALQKRNNSIADEAQAKQRAREAEALARCVLDKLPDATGDTAADAAYKACLPGHPVNYAEAPPRKGALSDFVLGYSSGASCTESKGGSTSSPRARRMIKAACEYLYGK